MTIFYVATLARYVLVDAESEGEAYTLGRAAFGELYPGSLVDIRTVREASADEIELWTWHQDMLNRETQQ